MKNEHQENGFLRGPLILISPASNLVAILSLDRLDATDQAAVYTNGQKELPGESTENAERRRPDFESLSRAGFATMPIMLETGCL
jgi:hypothetical protein